MSTHSLKELQLPQKLTFAAELWHECRTRNDFMPIVFEWYKHIGGTCITLASISRKSPAVRNMPPLHYAIMTGLLNRCSRLMLSNMRLAVTKKYGDTIRLLDRSIIESAVIVQWLCYKDNHESFQRYLAKGLKADLKLKENIQQNIEARNGDAWVIENRMLASIENCIKSTDMSEAQIRKTKDLPDLSSMCRDIGLSTKFYIGVQRMGSHAIHGTWTSLITHYLTQDEQAEYYLRDHDVRPNEDYFMAASLVMIETLERFFEYIVPSPDDRSFVEQTLAEYKADLLELLHEIVGQDFDVE